MLSIQNITKQYAQQIALQNISFEVPEAKIFGLLGPNGAGKTSLIRIINQITAPDAGQVFFNNQKLNQSHISKIGYLPEERGLYKKMEIGEQMIYLARLKNLTRADAISKAKYWFTKLDMQGWWNKKLEDLSKGMQQKVQFVASVLHQPQLIILDEPFTGLDPLNAQIITNEILELNKQGATIIFSTHRMESVEALCKHIVLLNKAHKILDGNLKDIRNSYRNGNFNVVIDKPLPLVSFNDFDILENYILDEGFGYRIKISNGVNLNQIILKIIEYGTLISIQEIIPSINSIFIENVKQSIA